MCACGSIDDGDNKRADVSPRGLLCFPVLSFFSHSFSSVLFFCFRPRSSLFFLSCWTDIGVCGGGNSKGEKNK